MPGCDICPAVTAQAHELLGLGPVYLKLVAPYGELAVLNMVCLCILSYPVHCSTRFDHVRDEMSCGGQHAKGCVCRAMDCSLCFV